MVGQRWRFALASMLLCVSGLASAQVLLYERENFGGRAFRAWDSVANLDEIGFNDRAASVEVRGGRWQLCDDAGFRGRCVTLEGGEYPSLRALGLDRRVSSIRELGWTPEGRGGYRDNPDGDRRPVLRNGPSYGAAVPRAILFTGQGLSGQAFVVDAGGIGDMKNTGFNDRARSVRIEGGNWIFCSDAHFGGACQIYGPGDDPALPRDQSDSISSGRPVSDADAYRGGDRRDRGPRGR